ncbi:hypothetical protein Agub_g8248 [Astrephomene gubernaculifera]|uniref:Protein kinase domain-containing protein n=1 Tax=Astrephomene gubernaculifera TaxID=47775 RepID=A0AAD3DTA6_9CHLO|nr:hypothetical protein Agub_g8248 [Astrephomene gubernaculifera]
MAFLARCISGNSLKGMVRGEAEEDDAGGSGSTTPNDTTHGSNKFSSYSWKRLSAKSRSALNSPNKPHTPPSSAASNDGNGQLPHCMEPVMERTFSALTDMEAVKFLVEDWPHKHWRPATPQDQDIFDRLEQTDIKPLVALGEGAYGSVNLCRIIANQPQPRPRNPSHCRSASAAAIFGAVGSSSMHGASRTAHSARAASSGGEDPAPATAGSPSKTSAAGSARSSCSGPNNQLNPQGQPGSSSCCGGAAAPAAAAAAAATAVTATASISGIGSGADGSSPSSSPSPSSSSGGANATSGGVIEAADPSLAHSSSKSSASVPPCQPPPADLEDAAISEVEIELSHEHLAGDGDEGGEVEGGEGEEERLLHQVSSVNDPQLIVAVKRVPLGWNQERELMQLHRCQQCAFIVRLFGFVDDGMEHCNYVMEWAEGGDLGAVLASLKDRRGSNKQRLLMSEASARYYMGCLLLAMDFLHTSGLLHRDIKPSNLLLTSDGTAKLADLGFTVALDANGQTVGCCGTTGYIAPEVFAYGTAKSRMAYGVTADIWSAGATLYQILTGQVVTDKHEEVLKKGWRPPTHECFSHSLRDLLNRMLAPKPTARPQSAASVMRHPWFSGFDWQALKSGRMKAPYVPSERRRSRQVGNDVTPRPSAAAAQDGNSCCCGCGSNRCRRASSGLSGCCGCSSCGGGSGGCRGGSSGGDNGPPTASPGGQRLSTVMERPPELMEGELPVQRSALSGRDEGSRFRGRDGLVREGSSYDTALGTVMPAGACAGADGGGAGAVHVPVADVAGVAPPPPAGAGAAQAHGHGHAHGMSVRFAIGVANCA